MFLSQMLIFRAMARGGMGLMAHFAAKTSGGRLPSGLQQPVEGFREEPGALASEMRGERRRGSQKEVGSLALGFSCSGPWI